MTIGSYLGKVRLKHGGAELRVFRPKRVPPNYEAIAYLEQALKSARAGEIQSVAIAATLSGRGVITAFSVSMQDNPLLLNGAVPWLGTRIMDAGDED
jgi:hypothetical protein